MLVKDLEAGASLNAVEAISISGDTDTDPHIVSYGARDGIFSVILPIHLDKVAHPKGLNRLIGGDTI